MDLVPEPLSIYISIGLISFLCFLWFISICCCRGPCRDFKKPVASTFEAHLSPAVRDSSAAKYDHYYYRLLGGWRPPGHTSTSRDQIRKTNENTPYLVPTPLAGLKGDQIPLRRSGYENDHSYSVDSVYSQDRETNDTEDMQKIPVIMVTSGTSSETGDQSRRSSEERSEKKSAGHGCSV